jgi:CBS domain containing-hemolysin-like protein
MTKNEESSKYKHNIKWVIKTILWTFAMAIFFSLITEKLMENLNIFFAFIILIVIIFIGIIFDIIGIAVTSADEKPFHSMASNQVLEAKYAIKLIKNAGKVSNFCNDVVGDICGIISGAAGASIIYEVIETFTIKNGTIISIIMTGVIASFTVGGKAIGKELAINKSEKILFNVAKFIKFFENKLGIKFLRKSDNRNHKT